MLVLLLSFSLGTIGAFEFIKAPGSLYGTVNSRAILEWEYEVDGEVVRDMSWHHIADTTERLICFVRNSTDTVYIHPDFANAKYKWPATLSLDPLRDIDAGNISFMVNLESGQSHKNGAPIHICQQEDRAMAELTPIGSRRHQCGENITVESATAFSIEVHVNNSCGAPVTVNVLQSCNLLSNTTLKSYNASADSNSSIELSCEVGDHVGIFVAVEHPAFEEPTEESCIFFLAAKDDTVTDGGGLTDGEIVGIAVGVTAGVGILAFILICWKKALCFANSSGATK